MYKVVKKTPGLRHRNARLGISLGQDYHQGEKLKALCDWAAQRFDAVEVMVADTLNRWNSMAEGCHDDDGTRAFWREAGDAWLRENRAIIETLPNLRLSRWDDYLTHPDFPESRRKMERAYYLNREFREALDTEAIRVMKKRGRQPNVLPYYRSYLLEDCAVNALLDDAENVYPGTVLPIWELLDLDTDPHFTRVSFLRREDRHAA